MAAENLILAKIEFPGRYNGERFHFNVFLRSFDVYLKGFARMGVARFKDEKMRVEGRRGAFKATKTTKATDQKHYLQSFLA